jgi:hypothetical protein
MTLGYAGFDEPAGGQTPARPKVVDRGLTATAAWSLHAKIVEPHHASGAWFDAKAPPFSTF